MDVYGQALKDYYEKDIEKELWLHTSYGEPEQMPLWYFFRSYEEMPDLEKMALSVCEGKVLDVGAGTGCHSLVLKQLGYDVTAIDTSHDCAEIMKASGLTSVFEDDYFSFDKWEGYHTILCLMNGIGFIGKLARLKDFLEKADELLVEDGQIILDSSDISYLYEDTQKPENQYFGEVSFQYECEGIKGTWFDWAYIDKDTLTSLAYELGWYTYILHTDENDQYLARLIRQ